MNKETKTVEVQEYLKSIWRNPSEKPSNKGYGDNVIPVMLIDSENNVSSFRFVSDDKDWNEVVEDEDVVFWSYVTDIRPNIPDLKDYKTIKTYEDACTALGEKVDEVTLTNAGVPKHIIALMKLELVCKALWGGEVKVYPDPNGNRTYYYPWFAFYIPKAKLSAWIAKKGVASCLLMRLLVRLRVSVLCMRIIVPRTRLRTVASACALIHTKRQDILEHSSWSCGQNTSHTISKLENA